VLGLTADSRDLRPHIPVQARGSQPEMSWPERLVRTALPPHYSPRPRSL